MLPVVLLRRDRLLAARRSDAAPSAHAAQAATDEHELQSIASRVDSNLKRASFLLAARDLSAMLAQAPDLRTGESLLLLGNCFLGTGELQRALALFDEALQLDPALEIASLSETESAACFSPNCMLALTQTYDVVLQRLGPSAELYFFKAMSLKAMGRLGASLNFFRLLQELDTPDAAWFRRVYPRRLEHEFFDAKLVVWLQRPLLDAVHRHMRSSPGPLEIADALLVDFAQLGVELRTADVPGTASDAPSVESVTAWRVHHVAAAARLGPCTPAQLAALRGALTVHADSSESSVLAHVGLALAALHALDGAQALRHADEAHAALALAHAQLLAPDTATATHDARQRAQVLERAFYSGELRALSARAFAPAQLVGMTATHSLCAVLVRAADICVLRARALRLLGRVDDASEALALAESLDAHSVDVHVQLFLLRLTAAPLQAAAQALHRAAQIRKRFCFYESDKEPALVHQPALAPATSSSDEAALHSALLVFASGNLLGADAILQQLLAATPGYRAPFERELSALTLGLPQTIVPLAGAFIALARYLESQVHLVELAFALSSHAHVLLPSAPALRAQAHALRRRENFDGALGVLDVAKVRARDALELHRVHAERGAVLVAAGRTAEAIADCSAALALRPDSVGLLCMRAAGWLARGQIAPAISDLERSFGLMRQADTGLLLARLLVTQRDTSRAIAVLQIVHSLPLGAGGDQSAELVQAEIAVLCATETLRSASHDGDHSQILELLARADGLLARARSAPAESQHARTAAKLTEDLLTCRGYLALLRNAPLAAVDDFRKAVKQATDADHAGASTLFGLSAALLMLGELGSAQAMLDRLLGVHRTHLSGLLLRAQTHFVQGRLGLAQIDADRAVSLVHGNASLSSNSAGVISLATERESEGAADRVLSNGRPEFVRGVIQLERRMFDEACRSFREALTSSDDELSNAILLRGVARYRSGDYAGARDDFARFERVQPGAQARLQLALARFMTGERQAALDVLSAVLLHEPSNGYAHLYLSACLHLQGRDRDALRSLTQAESLLVVQSSEVHLSAGAMHAAANEHNEAIAHFQAGLDCLTRSTLARGGTSSASADELGSRAALANAMAASYLELGDASQAERAVAEALACNPHLADAHHNRGLVLLVQHDAQAAQGAFRRCRELDAGHASVDYSEALALMELREYDTAAERLTVVLVTGAGMGDSARTCDVLVNRGMCHWQAHRYDAALDDLNAAVHADPSSLLARLNRAHVHLRMSRFGSAGRDLRFVLVRASAEDAALAADARHMQELVRSWHEFFLVATSDFMRAVCANPRHCGLLNWADVALDAGWEVVRAPPAPGSPEARSAQAELAAVMQLVAAAPLNEALRVRRALLLLRCGDVAAAEADLFQARTVCAKTRLAISREARVLWARVQQLQGRMSAAAAELRDVLLASSFANEDAQFRGNVLLYLAYLESRALVPTSPGEADEAHHAVLDLLGESARLLPNSLLAQTNLAVWSWRCSESRVCLSALVSMSRIMAAMETPRSAMAVAQCAITTALESYCASLDRVVVHETAGVGAAGEFEQGSWLAELATRQGDLARALGDMARAPTYAEHFAASRNAEDQMAYHRMFRTAAADMLAALHEPDADAASVEALQRQCNELLSIADWPTSRADSDHDAPRRARDRARLEAVSFAEAVARRTEPGAPPLFITDYYRDTIDQLRLQGVLHE